MRFYLGTHQPAWLTRDLDVPLLVSHRRLAGRRTLPRATTRWACDSGGFVELSLHGCWRVDAAEYVAAVRRYATEIGQLDWAAPMDHMCEPHVLARTGATVDAHQRRTVDNYLRLRDLASDLPFIPVLQGDTAASYERCADLYDRAGVDLAALPVGSQDLWHILNDLGSGLALVPSGQGPIVGVGAPESDDGVRRAPERESVGDDVG